MRKRFSDDKRKRRENASLLGDVEWEEASADARCWWRRSVDEVASCFKHSPKYKDE